MSKLRLLFVLIFLGSPALVFASDTQPDVLTLKEAHRLALSKNERLNIRRNDVKISNQEVRTARSQLLPELVLNAESTRREEVRTFGSFPRPERATDYSAILDQPIYQGGKNYYGLRLRKLQRKASKKTLFRRKQVVLFEVTKVYYDVLLAKRRVEIEKNTLRRARKQLERAQSRREVGKVTQNAVLRAEVQVSEAEENLVQAKNQVQLAREDLAVELGQSAINDRLRSPNSSPLSDTPSARYESTAFEHRRDLQRAEVLVDAADNRMKARAADYYPDLNFSGRYDHFDNENFQGTEEDWRLTIQGSYPLFSGWREEAQWESSKFQKRNAKQQYRRLKREVRRNVRSVLLDLRTQLKVIKTLEDRVESARENHAEITARFKQGLVDAVDVSDAITILNEAELRLASARNNLELDRIRLKLAIGTFSDDLIRTRRNRP